MSTETTTTATIDRAAEAARYTRYGRTADRLRRMSRGDVRTYRGRYPHEWFSLARVAARMVNPVRDLRCDECGHLVSSAMTGETPGAWCPMSCGGALRSLDPVR